MKKKKHRNHIARYLLFFIPLILLLIAFVKVLRYTPQLDEKISEKTVNAACPYAIPKSEQKKYTTTDLVDNMAIAPAPIFPVTKNQVVVNEPFDPYAPPAGESFFPPNTYPWTAVSFDVTNDGQNEQILTANIAMNHTPHLVRIVQNGTVIFKYQGINVDPEEVESHDGFMLNETLDWLTGTSKRTRYIYKDGTFIPAWYQIYCQAQMPQ
ncbi:MAG: hypothetical protein HYV40_06820 [Candidatus Levybacteria bacterium]|nr:hypothetical protein [Candidatus Levybacteria bacterium]